MLLRSCNRVQVHCDCGAGVEYNADTSAEFMRAVGAVAQGYRVSVDWMCPLCKRSSTIGVHRAQSFLRIWTV